MFENVVVTVRPSASLFHKDRMLTEKCNLCPELVEKHEALRVNVPECDDIIIISAMPSVQVPVNELLL